MNLKQLILLAIAFSSLLYSACHQEGDGFTHKWQAGNKMKDGLKDGKWAEDLDVACKPAQKGDQVYAYVLTVYFAGKPSGIQRTYLTNGDLLIESPYKNGEKDGIEKQYFDESYQLKKGSLCAERPFVNGKENGIEKDYYKSGKIDVEIPYADDKINGIAKGYWETGKLQHETPWLNGAKNGLEKQYYESGKLQAENMFKNDSLNGVCKAYYENGNLYKEDTEYCGKQTGICKVYYPDGKIRSLYKSNMDTIIESQEYYENGQLKEQIPYLHNVLNGIKKEYYESGKLKREEPYTDWVINGLVMEYYESGKLKRKVNYMNGDSGTTATYNENGKEIK